MVLPAAALPLLPAVGLPVLPAYRDLSTLTIRQLTLETRDQESTIAFCKAVSEIRIASMCLLGFFVNATVCGALCWVLILLHFNTYGIIAIT